MAALAIGRCFLSKKSSSCQETYGRNDMRTPISMSCQNRESMDHFNPKIKKEKKGDHHKDKGKMQQIFLTVEKLGKGLKDSLSPKQKGDWKDLTLMSLSFAVYVYISQKLVCAYCAWMSMLDQPW